MKNLFLRYRITSSRRTLLDCVSPFVDFHIPRHWCSWEKLEIAPSSRKNPGYALVSSKSHSASQQRPTLSRTRSERRAERTHTLLRLEGSIRAIARVSWVASKRVHYNRIWNIYVECFTDRTSKPSVISVFLNIEKPTPVFGTGKWIHCNPL